MATITFWGRDEIQATNLGGSGIGWYNDGGFGTSVAVGSFNGRTFITDSTGTSEGPEINNCKYLNTSGVVVGQSGSGIHILRLPNYLSTMNVRFEHGSAVQVQNVLAYASDRANKNNNPSGITIWGAEIIHPDTVQTFSGSGDTNWINMKGSGTTLGLVSGPGISGLSPNGPTTSDVRHDWFVGLSGSPGTVGSKEAMITVELEYL